MRRVLALALALLAACAAPAAPSAPTPSALSTLVPGWVLHEDPAFTIGYPGSWSLQRGTPESGLLFVAHDAGGTGASISLMRETLAATLEAHVAGGVADLRASGRLTREPITRTLEVPAGTAVEVRFEAQSPSDRVAAAVTQYVIARGGQAFIITVAYPAAQATLGAQTAARVAQTLRLR